MASIGAGELRWQSSALLALQEAAEAYLVHLFEDARVPISVPQSPPSHAFNHCFADMLHGGDTEIYVQFMPSESRLCRRIYSLPGGFVDLGLGLDEQRELI